MIAFAGRQEFEQATLRVVLAGVVLIYLLWFVRREPTAGPEEYKVLVVTGGFLAFSVLLWLWLVGARLVGAPHVSVPRRLIAVVGDNALITYGLCQMGEGGGTILFVYFFIAFGNGARYGRFYLHASQLMGLVGFSVVLAVSPFWSNHVGIGIGFLIGLVSLPFYVAILLDRLDAVRMRAEKALTE